MKIIYYLLTIFYLPLTFSLTMATERPNVIIILADDLGYGDLGCFGHAKFKTPNIDRMATQGAKLTHFYSSAPYCAPSRVSLQTGRYQFRTGLTSNPVPRADTAHEHDNDELGMNVDEVTIGDSFQRSGYRTIHIGKWHLGHQKRHHPMRHGYHEYYGILYSNDMHRVELLEGEKVVEYPLVQATLTRRYTERAEKFIETNKDRPFFLYLAHAMPHKPLACSEEFYKQGGDRGLYGDVIAELDWSVGRVLAKVKELGLDEKTLVYFTSDNGPWYGGSTGGLRGMKSRTFEGGLRVPLIARWPGKIPSGHVSAEPAIMMDLFTTTLNAANVPLPNDRNIDGKDIFPLFTSDAKSPHEVLFGMRRMKLFSARSGKWRLHVRAPYQDRVWRPDEEWIDPRAPDGVRLIAPFEQAHPSQYPGLLTGDPVKGLTLFNLETDPGEQRNVAAENPEVVKRLKALCDEFVTQFPKTEK